MSNTFIVNIISPGKEPFVADIKSLKTVSEDGEIEFSGKSYAYNN